MPAIVRFDAVPGLVPVLLDELAVAPVEAGDGHVTTSLDELRAALAVRTAYASYAALAFDVPRPKALLADASIRAIDAAVRDVLALHPAGTFTAVRLGAAGADSPVMRRLATRVADAAGLPVDDRDGDLLVRVIPRWQVLVRLTPRPQSDRTWQAPGFEGALDASVAAAMVRLTEPRPDDVFLDPTCGSGTIVVERRLAGPARAIVAGDVDPAALAAARANTAAQLARLDATALPVPDASITAVAANPPWGNRFRQDLDTFTADLLAEIDRVTAPGGRVVVLTHDVRRFERAARDRRRWRVERQLRLELRGVHPRLYVLADSAR